MRGLTVAEIGRTHREIQQGGHRIDDEDELWRFHSDDRN